MAYDFSQPFYNYGQESFWSGNPFRFNTGGASPSLRAAASQLINGNAGTVGANMATQAGNRQAQQGLTQYMNAARAGGAGGNYNLFGGVARNLYGGAQDNAMRAYGQGAEINQRGVSEGGQLIAKADELDQAGKDASLKYLASLRPEQFNGYNDYLNTQYANNEGYWQGLGKSIIASLPSLAANALI